MTVIRKTGAPDDIALSAVEKTGKCRKKHSIPIITSENEKSLRFHEKHGFVKRGELVGVDMNSPDRPAYIIIRRRCKNRAVNLSVYSSCFLFDYPAAEENIPIVKDRRLTGGDSFLRFGKFDRNFSVFLRINYSLFFLLLITRSDRCFKRLFGKLKRQEIRVFNGKRLCVKFFFSAENDGVVCGVFRALSAVRQCRKLFRGVSLFSCRPKAQSLPLRIFCPYIFR